MDGNWGRWGKEDQAGALNLIDARKRLSALSIPQRGEVYSLGQDIRPDGVPMAPDGVRGFFIRPLHMMLYDGGDEASGCSTRGDNYFSSEDYLGIRIHGSTTHVDALSHGWKDQTLYNGFSRDTVNSFGASKLGIENAPHFVTRGVLFDVARSKGIDHVDIDYEITVDDLKACHDVALEPGDAVLVRTGWHSVYYSDPDSYNQFAWPGLGIDAVRWLAGQDVVLIGADNIGVEIASPVFIQTGSRGHGMLLRDYGIYILELLNLEELSASGAVEFLFTMAPLRIAGGTGSPVNPLAVV
ncbi:cyclase family protein [Streptomyces sp. NPDC002758]